MFNISSYLEKFKTIGAQGILLKEKVIQVIKEKTKIEILKKDVEIKNGIISLKINSAAKSHIFIKKSSILKELEGGEMKIVDIR